MRNRAVSFLMPPSNLPNLQNLDLGSCKNISAEAVGMLKMARPNLTVVHY
jgi:hypothetical protein